MSLLQMPAHVQARFEQQTDGGFPLYAENEKVAAVFLAMQSQWNIVSGMGGAIWAGLRYEALDRPFRRMKITADEEDEIFDDIRLMEAVFMSERNRRQDG